MAKRGGQKKENWKKKRKQEYLEKKEFRYYIFCEGQATEPKYFQEFKLSFAIFVAFKKNRR